MAAEGTIDGAEEALEALARRLASEGSPLAPHVRVPDAVPALARLVAAGPRTGHRATEYGLVIESVREGYLLHYGTPRLLEGADRDLALLAGDYLYAIGLDTLAGLGDLEAVRELADLISIAAALHSGPGAGRATAESLWLASATVIACGGDEAHEAAKAALRGGDVDPGPLWRQARARAARGGLEQRLIAAAEAIDFPADDLALG